MQLRAGHIIYARNAWGIVVGGAGEHPLVRWAAHDEQYCSFKPEEVSVILDLGRTPTRSDILWLHHFLFPYEYSRQRAKALFLRIVFDQDAKKLLDWIGHDGMPLSCIYDKNRGFASYTEDSLRILIDNGYALQDLTRIDDDPYPFIEIWAVLER